MARPKKKPNEKLTHRLPHIRCTEFERKEIDERAKELGMSVSDYIRKMALTGSIIVQQTSVDFELVNQLKRIGVNLNQIVHIANIRQQVPRRLVAIYDELEGVLDRVIEKIL